MLAVSNALFYYFYFIDVCVALSVCMCTLCMQVPKEARGGQQSPEAGITGSHELEPNLRFSVRAAKLLTVEPFPGTSIKYMFMFCLKAGLSGHDQS